MPSIDESLTFEGSNCDSRTALALPTHMRRHARLAQLADPNYSFPANELKLETFASSAPGNAFLGRNSHRNWIRSLLLN